MNWPARDHPQSANAAITDSGEFTISGAECYKINTDGTVLGSKIIVTVNGLSITFSS